MDAYRTHYQRSRDLVRERLAGMPAAFSYRKPRGRYLMIP